MSEIRLRPGEGWGVLVAVSLPCGHRIEVLREWISANGRFDGRIGCTEPGCRRRFENVVLEGWPGRGS